MATKRSGGVRRIWSTINAWDFWIALVGAIVAAVLMVMSERPLDSTRAVGIAAFSGGAALAAVDWSAMRWVSDRMKNTEYGELVRADDRDESDLSLPYWVVATCGVLLALLGIVGAALDGEMSRHWLVVYWTALIFSAAYALLGSFSLAQLTLWHQKQSAAVQSSREATERMIREAQRQQNQPNKTSRTRKKRQN